MSFLERQLDLSKGTDEEKTDSYPCGSTDEVVDTKPEGEYSGTFEYPGARHFTYDSDLQNYGDCQIIETIPPTHVKDQHEIDCENFLAKINAPRESKTLSFFENDPVQIPGICDGEIPAIPSTFFGDESMTNVNVFNVPNVEKIPLIKEPPSYTQEELANWNSYVNNPEEYSMYVEEDEIGLVHFKNSSKDLEGLKEKKPYLFEGKLEDENRPYGISNNIYVQRSGILKMKFSEDSRGSYRSRNYPEDDDESDEEISEELERAIIYFNRPQMQKKAEEKKEEMLVEEKAEEVKDEKKEEEKIEEKIEEAKKEGAVDDVIIDKEIEVVVVEDDEKDKTDTKDKEKKNSKESEKDKHKPTVPASLPSGTKQRIARVTENEKKKLMEKLAKVKEKVKLNTEVPDPPRPVIKSEPSKKSPAASKSPAPKTPQDPTKTRSFAAVSSQKKIETKAEDKSPSGATQQESSKIDVKKMSMVHKSPGSIIQEETTKKEVKRVSLLHKSPGPKTHQKSVKDIKLLQKEEVKKNLTVNKVPIQKQPPPPTPQPQTVSEILQLDSLAKKVVQLPKIPKKASASGVSPAPPSKKAHKESPKQVQKELPKEVPKESPKKVQKESPKQPQKELPKQTQKESPKPKSTDIKKVQQPRPERKRRESLTLKSPQKEVAAPKAEQVEKKSPKPRSAKAQHPKSEPQKQEKEKSASGNFFDIFSDATCSDLGLESNDDSFANIILPLTENPEDILTNESGELYLMQDDFIEGALNEVSSTLDKNKNSTNVPEIDSLESVNFETVETSEAKVFPKKNELIKTQTVRLFKDEYGLYVVPKYLCPTVLLDKLCIIPGCFRYSPGLIQIVLIKTAKLKERSIRRVTESRAVSKTAETNPQAVVPQATEESASLAQQENIPVQSVSEGLNVTEPQVQNEQIGCKTLAQINFESESKKFVSRQIDDFEKRFLAASKSNS